MKNHLSIILIATLGFGTVWAGNPDRAGSAGAGQLLINPWAASNGLARLYSWIVRLGTYMVWRCVVLFSTQPRDMAFI